jgi:single-strand DNA-binding protein
MATNLRLLSLNDLKVVGRLTRDPELRYTPQGTPVCHFRIAVSRSYKTPNSTEWKEEVAFVPCTVWRETAERCGQRLKKGSPVYVEGRLKSRDWQTKEGQKRTDLEVDVQKIQFLEMAGDAASAGAAMPAESMGDEGGSESGAPVAASYGRGKSAPSVSSNNDDDEVPF